jgi:spore protease
MEFTKYVDLAVESYTRDEKSEKSNGIITTIENFCGTEIIKTEIINHLGEEKTGKEIGTYLTLPVGEVYKYSDEEKNRIKNSVGTAITYLINEIAPKSKSFLVVGLGNKSLCADSLGCLVTDELIPTRHLKKTNPSLLKKLGYDLIALTPGVLGQSGIDACEHIKSLLENFEVDLVIIIDSFMTLSKDRLLKTVQVSNTGVLPGSARDTTSQKINKKALGKSVISIGVPTAISLRTSDDNIKLTKTDVEYHVKALSKTIADGILIAIKKCFSNNDILSDIE